MLLYVNIYNVCPSSSVWRGASTVLPNVFWHECMNTCEALGYDEKSSGVDYNFIGSGVGTIRTKEVCSHMWLSPDMATTSCWITPASFNIGVFSFCRLYYANLFEVTCAYTIIYICLYVITWTLMLSLGRNDSTARCTCGGRGECSCNRVQQAPGPVPNRSCLQWVPMPFGSTHFQALGRGWSPPPLETAKHYPHD